jgi:hypothetical protein
LGFSGSVMTGESEWSVLRRRRHVLGFFGCRSENAIGQDRVSHTAAGLLLGLLGLGLLPPLGLSLLDQALLACVLMLDLCALRNGVERRLVVNTVDNTGDESRVAEDLSRKVVNIRSRMG